MGILETILIVLLPFVSHFIGWLLYKLTVLIEDYHYRKLIKSIIKLRNED